MHHLTHLPNEVLDKRTFTIAVRAQKTNKTNSVHFKAASLLCAQNAPCAFPTFHCSSMTLKIIEHRHWRSDSKTAEREDAACWTSLTHMRVFLVKISGTIIHKWQLRGVKKLENWGGDIYEWDLSSWLTQKFWNCHKIFESASATIKCEIWTLLNLKRGI